MELTEILVTVKQPDYQNNASYNAGQNDYSYEGKSFNDLVNDYSSENQTISRTDESKTDVKPEEKVASTKDSQKEEPVSKTGSSEEKLKKTEKSDEKVSEENDSEEKQEKSPNFDLYSLNLVKEENIVASDSALKAKDLAEIGNITEGLLNKMAEKDDAERIKILSEGKTKITSDNDEDFEFEIVSDDVIALESAQFGSVENPADFLNNFSENKESDAKDLVFARKDSSVEKSGLDELKSKINVTDYRTEKTDIQKSSEKTDSTLKVTMNGNDNATIEMNLNQTQVNVSTDVLSSNAQVSSSNGSNFQAMLNNQIQANASEIVKTGNIVLKDNNKGTINLVLHPDDIGNVKLSLSLDGKNITGHIAVNTKEALEVFKNNAETLREAFIKNGFENASFDVSYNSSSSGSNQFAEQNQQNQQNQNAYFAKREYSSLDQIIESPGTNNISEEFSEISKFGINIVA